MPLYQQIIMSMPQVSKDSLAKFFRTHSKAIIANGGVVRGVENHGIRPLPERARRKYAATDGSRHFWEARYCTVTFDASPKCLIEAERVIKGDEVIIRYFTLKQDSTSERIYSETYKNPFMFPDEKKGNNVDWDKLFEDSVAK